MTAPHLGRHRSAEVLHGNHTVADILDQSIWVPSIMMSGAAPAAGETQGTASVLHSWAFDAAIIERVRGMFWMPVGWTTAIFTFVWSNAGAGAGAVMWQIDYGPADEGVLTTGTLPGTLQQATETAGAQFALSHTPCAATAVTSGKVTLFLVDRVATNAADTLANDAWLHGLLVTKAS